MANEEYLKATAVHVAETYAGIGMEAASTLAKYSVPSSMYSELKPYIAEELKSRGFNVENT